MCGSVQNQPVYTPPPACPAPAAPQAAPKVCTPPPCAPVDTFTPPPPPVVSPEKAAPIAPTVASPERPTITSAPNADAPAACAKNETVAPERKGKGLMKMLGAIFSAVFSFASMFMNRRPDVANADARPERNRTDSHACARDWRNFEGRARPRVIAPERDVRPQVFTPSTYGQRT